MASSMIHICVANELNKKLKRDKRRFLIGTIAPDISKQIGETKDKSHFLKGVGADIPDLEKFLQKYKSSLCDDFVLGYYVHLYTDYIWFKYFIPSFLGKMCIYKLDGTKVAFTSSTLKEYMYKDYTNLNSKLIDEYELDLEIFYEELPSFENIIEEIPMDKLSIIVNKAGEIIKNSKEGKAYLFEMNEINKFISMSVSMILDNLKGLDMI